MKKTLFLAAFIFSLTLAQAQKLHYGYLAGANLNRMKLDTELYLNCDYDNCKRPFALGFREGIFVEYTFLDFLGIQGEVSFNEYGYRLKINNETSREYPIEEGMTIVETSISEGRGKTIMNDISVSLLLKFYLCKQRFSIDLGAQPSWTLSAYREEEVSVTTAVSLDGVELGRETTNSEFSNSIPFAPYNFSVIGGASYYINKNIFVSARYMFGLEDIFSKEAGYIVDEEYIIKTIPQESKNRVIQLSLGLRF